MQPYFWSVGPFNDIGTQDVDAALKNVCEQMITDVNRSVLEPLSSFLLKVSAFKMRNDRKSVMRDQAFASTGT
jgi:hypothetical protein